MSYGEIRDLAMGLIDKKTASRPVSINSAALKKELEHPTGVPVLISGIASVSDVPERATPPAFEAPSSNSASSAYTAPAESEPVSSREPFPVEESLASPPEPAYVPTTPEPDDSEEGDEAGI
jgi:hypothetical protein